MPTFSPRTYDVPFCGNPLFMKMKFQRGYALLKTGTAYREVRNPTAEEVQAADIAYLGGHTYMVSSQEAADLTAAGYTVT